MTARRRGRELRDYQALERLFASKPEVVLSYFETAHVGCLMELDCFARLCVERPEVAARIVLVAVTMGIPTFPDGTTEVAMLPVRTRGCVREARDG
jgi:hypothetical protein